MRLVKWSNCNTAQTDSLSSALGRNSCFQRQDDVLGAKSEPTFPFTCMIVVGYWPIGERLSFKYKTAVKGSWGKAGTAERKLKETEEIS